MIKFKSKKKAQTKTGKLNSTSKQKSESFFLVLNNNFNYLF